MPGQLTSELLRGPPATLKDRSDSYFIPRAFFHDWLHLQDVEEIPSGRS
jgi:hypothetical protein